MAASLLSATYFAGLLATTLGACIHGNAIQRRAEPLQSRAVEGFGYTGEQGPLNWWNLDPANVLCATGRNQSPININPGAGTTTIVEQGNGPVFNYPNQRGTFENLGVTVEAKVEEGGLTFDGAEYTLNQFHFHTPSEHRLEEEYFPLEAHFVHTRNEPSPDGQGNTLVIGLFFQLEERGRLFDLFRETIGRVGEISAPDSEIEARLRFEQVVEHLKANVLYQYSGSLTTPPCTEGVTWLVSGAPVHLDVRTYNAVKDVVNFNSRYTQNDPGRENLLDRAADLFCPA